MGYRVLAQVGMIGAALFIIFTVIAPKLEDIKASEDQTAQYKAAVDNAAAYNSQLAQLVSQKNSFTQGQLEDLEAYMPTDVDEIQVMADLQTIALQAGLRVEGIALAEDSDTDQQQSYDQFEYDEFGEPVPVSREQVEHTDFLITARGVYSNIKRFLEYVEFNKYQLEIVDLAFNKASEGGTEERVDLTNPEFSFNLTVRAYNFTH